MEKGLGAEVAKAEENPIPAAYVEMTASFFRQHCQTGVPDNICRGTGFL
jgi:hypothetical protein